MKIIADLHVHSKYSRATAKNLDLENLYVWAQKKGITIVGTGDCTHPAWVREIEKKLEPAEPGLFKLKHELAQVCDNEVPLSCQNPVRFILQGEISCIYKKNDKTRKNHNIVFFPDISSLKKFNQKLDQIGNITSDGRPILGLDAKNLLQILLDSSSDAFLVPAHIWTPWFSVLGSKSGFDSIAQCFEELSDEIFAVETGLSSDPPMNWRIKELDTMTLISNSDAHSPANLGRNANLFDIELSYFALKNALKNKNPKKCLGTFDMYPELGKYHLDGHRKCQVCMHPKETIKRKNICPTCNQPVVIGVLNQVEKLANRSDGAKPKNTLPCQHIIPLPEIISEICSCGPKSKKVQTNYHQVLENLGPEMYILNSIPLEKIAKGPILSLSEAINKMRKAEIQIQAGYDGEFGKIKIF